MSVAEFDVWVLKTLLGEKSLAKKDADRLWNLFRPCYKVAHADAADIMTEKRVKGTATASTHDFIEFPDFRYGVAYLVVYAGMLDAFQLVDGGSTGLTTTDDRRISLDEWMATWHEVRGYGFCGFAQIANNASIEDAESVFRDMDSDGGGMVLFGEWCSYLKSAEFQANTAIGLLLSVEEKKTQSYPEKAPNSQSGPTRVVPRRSNQKAKAVSSLPKRDIVQDRFGSKNLSAQARREKGEAARRRQHNSLPPPRKPVPVVQRKPRIRIDDVLSKDFPSPPSRLHSVCTIQMRWFE